VRLGDVIMFFLLKILLCTFPYNGCGVLLLCLCSVFPLLFQEWLPTVWDNVKAQMLAIMTKVGRPLDLLLDSCRRSRCQQSITYALISLISLNVLISLVSLDSLDSAHQLTHQLTKLNALTNEFTNKPIDQKHKQQQQHIV
jgi:hypothetical protein